MRADSEPLIDELREKLRNAEEANQAAADHIVRLEEDVQRLKTQWAAFEMQKVEWGRQKATLSQKYVELETRSEQQEERLRVYQLGVNLPQVMFADCQNGAEYGVVILEGQPRLVGKQ
jgi:chromosome segregation ATPase